MSISPDRALRTLLALLAAALLALGAAACGSDDGSDDGAGYLRSLDRAQAEYLSDAGELNLANPSSPQAFGRSLDRLIVFIDTLVGRFDGIEPPDDVAPQHRRLIAELRDYAQTIREQKGDLTSEDEKSVDGALTEIGKASTTFSTDFSATIDQIGRRLESG
jgi:hypothetical protein